MSETQRLMKIYLENDRVGIGAVVPLDALRRAIVAVAEKEGLTHLRYPWETGDEYTTRLIEETDYVGKRTGKHGTGSGETR